MLSVGSVGMQNSTALFLSGANACHRKTCGCGGFYEFFWVGVGPCRRAPLMWRHRRHQDGRRRPSCPKLGSRCGRRGWLLGRIKRLRPLCVRPPTPLGRELAGANCVITIRVGDGALLVSATPAAFREAVCPPDSLPGLRRLILAAPPIRPRRPTSMAIPTALDTKAPASLAVATAPDKLPVSPLNETPSMLPVNQVANPRTPAASPVIIPRNASYSAPAPVHPLAAPA